MLRNVYLEGEMGEKFGTSFQIYAESIADVIRCLDVNTDDEIRKYLVDCHNKDIGFVIDVADNTFDDESELLMPMHEGDVTITPMPAGSKSAFGKILAAIAIAVVAINAPFLFGTTGTTTVAAGGGVATVTAGTAGVFGTYGSVLGMSVGTISSALGGLAVNLAMAGIQQMMAPDPSIDTSAPENYLFNGPQSNIVQGDPVPVLYGRLRVPGQPVNFEISGTGVPKLNTFVANEDGSSYVVERNNEREQD